MHTMMLNKSRWGALLLGVLAALILMGSSLARAATLPAATGTLAGSTRTFDLWAKQGTTSLPGGATVNVWGYTDSASGAVTLPGGPALVVNQGETVVVNLTNTLPEASAILFQGQGMVPDATGAAASTGTRTYTFTATSPGTFLYEAGLLPNSQHQAAMGLYGALIVRPTSDGTATGTPILTRAYADAATTFVDEGLLILGEIDPALNNSVNPAAFDMRDYAPKYFLIGGKPYPATDPIASAAGNKVLLRYVNAGIQHHSMAVLGLRQIFVAKDAGVLPTFNHDVVAETLAPGQTGDALATVPAAATTESRFALYDGGLMLHNNGAPGFGGMLTFVTAGSGSPDTGPVASAVAAAPSPTNGSVDVALSASISVAASSTWNVDAAEYFIDATGAAGTGTAMAGAFGSPTVSVSATLSPALLATLASGKHTLYVHGRRTATDPAGKWGAFSSTILNLDKTGPVTSGLTLTPNPSNGTVSVALHATGNDMTTGGANIAAAEYFIGATGANGTGTPMTVNIAAPIASLDATIAAPVTGGIVSVHSQDALGNWGSFATITLSMVASGPVTSSVGAAPNPNNGALPLNTSNPVVRVTATMTSTGSTVSAAEGFIDTVGANGTGFQFVPSDGVFNGASETGYADVPLSTINQLGTGNHTIYVRGRDAAGNWGATSTTILVIDKAAPTVSAATLTPSASNNTAVTISASASDAATGNSNIVAGEYFIDAIGAAGTGAAMTAAAAAPSTTIGATIPAATIAALAAGNHTVNVRSRDAAGNWSSTTASATLLIDRTVPTFTSITIAPTAIIAGTASVNLAVNGATDPLLSGLASGVTGGEYWFGATNIAPGTGTSFTGTSGLSVDTSALTSGTNTLRVRVRDAAGNWSTVVRTATLTVADDAIFSDGFESGTLSPLTGWTAVSTSTGSRLSVTGAAALQGGFGLQAQGNNANYVQYGFGTTTPFNPAWPTYDARFYFNPNGNTGNNQDILVGRFGNATVFRVRYRWNAGAPQVQIQVGTGTSNASWTGITTGAANRIEAVWQAAGSSGPNPGTLDLHVNGVLSQTLTTTSTSSVNGVRLGSVTSGGSNILEYFDAFVSKRSVSPLIGP